VHSISRNNYYLQYTEDFWCDIQDDDSSWHQVLRLHEHKKDKISNAEHTQSAKCSPVAYI